MKLEQAPRRSLLSKIGKLIRTILLAILVAFLVGFTIGTLLRGEIEKPVRYIGAIKVAEPWSAVPPSLVVGATDPSHVLDA